MDERENRLRAYTFKGPEYIPMNFAITSAAWNYYGIAELDKLIRRHGRLFPHYTGKSKKDIRIKPYRIKDVRYIDSWGCVWKTEQEGSTGSVIKHPIETWEDFASFTPADPGKQNGWEDINWSDIEKSINSAKIRGDYTQAGLRHGFLFLTLSYIRGFENLMYDMHDEEPYLDRLIGIIEGFNKAVISKYLRLDVDVIGFPEDLGAQDRLLLSPEMFRKYIKPVYTRLMNPVKEAGKPVHMHSDGYILDIIDDLIECGVDIINLQDLVNGIDNIQKHVKGKMAIDLDIDRQDITVRGTPGDIDDLMKEAVMKLGSHEGGLSFIYGFYPGTPLRNADAVMAAMEKYSIYYK
ncbi:MAG: uroporphyrinogen decarboxylase family protein [Clostridia bacterium]|nr:uroporphyrinogen decarboxylase family protein [Clostridia bacterium]